MMRKVEHLEMFINYYYFAQNLIVCVGFRGVQQTSQPTKTDSIQPNLPSLVIF